MTIKLCIAVLTTATRGETLSECLYKISELELPNIEKVDLLVVQNRIEESFEVTSLVNSMSHERIKFTTILEPSLGIPMARNCALKFAQENDYTHVGFIDDDAKPNIDWLDKIVLTLTQHNVHAATGPQVPIFPEHTSDLYKNAKVYKERELPDKSICKWAATNNVVFDVVFAKKNNLYFSEDMKTGGSDKEFFSRYSKCGGKIIWVSDAVVYEYVEKSRINYKWAIRRTFRFGGTGFRIEKSDKSTILAFLICLLKGNAYIAKGMIGIVSSPFKKKRSVIDGVCDIAHGIAFILSIFSGGKLKRYT